MSNIQQENNKVNKKELKKSIFSKFKFVSEFCKIADTLRQREFEVIVLRSGILSGKGMTLIEVGDIFGLTRERIRIIEKGVFDKDLKEYARNLSELISEAEKGKKELISVYDDDLNRVIPGVKEFISLFSYIVEKSDYPKKVSHQNHVLSELRELQMDALRILAFKAIKAKCKPEDGVSKAQCQAVAKMALIPKMGDISAIERTIETISNWAVAQFRFGDDDQMLGTISSEASVFLDVLSESETPLSIKEIGERSFKITGKSVKPTYIRNMCIANPLIFNLGPSTFGLERHISIPASKRKKVESIMFDLAQKSQKVSFHFEEAYDSLINKKVLAKDEIKSHKELSIIVKNSKRLVSLGYDLFTTQEKSSLFEKSKRSVSSDIEDILDRAGSPLPKERIIEQLSKYRDLRSTFQIPVWGRIVPVGENFGLLGRDVPYDPVNASAFAASIKSRFEKRKDVPYATALKEFKSLFNWTLDFQPSGHYLCAILRMQKVQSRFVKNTIKQGYVSKSNSLA